MGKKKKVWPLVLERPGILWAKNALLQLGYIEYQSSGRLSAVVKKSNTPQQQAGRGATLTPGYPHIYQLPAFIRGPTINNGFDLAYRADLTEY